MKLEKQMEAIEKMFDEMVHEASPSPYPNVIHQTHADGRAGGAGHTRHPFPVHGMYRAGGDDLSPFHGHPHAHGIGLYSEGSSSPSSSLSGNISPDGGDPFRHSPELGGPHTNPIHEAQLMMDQRDLMCKLRAMHLHDVKEPMIRHPHMFRSSYDGVTMRSPVGKEDEAIRHTFCPNTLSFDEERTPSVLPKQHYFVGSNLFDSSVATRRLDDPSSYPNGFRAASRNFRYGNDVLGSSQLRADGFIGRNSNGEGIRDQDLFSSVHRRPSIVEANLLSQQNGFDRNSSLLYRTSSSSFHGVLPEELYGSAVTNWRAGPSSNSLPPHSLSLIPHSLSSSVRNTRNIEAFDFEDSFIIQGKGLPCVGSDGRDLHRGKRRWQLNNCSHTRGSHVNLDRMRSPRLPPLNYDNLIDIDIYYMAKDQHGCRFLQGKFDEGEPQVVDEIFNAIIDHVVELMVNPFGNYLIQKLLDVCSEEQRMRILLVLTKDPSELVRISLNTHGTRAVQKLIETLKNTQQKVLVISALKPGFLDLIKDLNGNHVVQCCLQSLSTEYNNFIFAGAAMHCVDIATHRHGCVVLQSCIDYSTGEHRANLLAEISVNGLLLAQDAFGNYVVQYILKLGNPSATAILISQFEGNYVLLSKQKFSSNVVEGCLKVFREEDRATIVTELLSVSPFEQLLQDPYANYVIQSALKNTKGSIRAALDRAIRPYEAHLRTSPYCKRIFSRTSLKN